MMLTAVALATWTAFAPQGGGFAVEVPGPPIGNPTATHFAFALNDSAFSIDLQPLPESIQRAIAGRDRALVLKALEGGRNAMVAELKGTPGTFDADDFEGLPSMAYTFSGTLGERPFVARTRIVFVAAQIVIVSVLGPKDELQASDITRFHDSFHLIRPVAFTDAVCGRIPAVPITFEMPSDFVSRRVEYSSEAGCLWGVPDDLDHVTKDPAAGDFTALRRGVFRARLSTNVIYSERNRLFDQLDGKGETGLRADMEAAGAHVVVWKREDLGGLPALQIVAELNGSRVYMLYLGNTKYVSNTMLINYYGPADTSPENDAALWGRFVYGIKHVP